MCEKKTSSQGTSSCQTKRCGCRRRLRRLGMILLVVLVVLLGGLQLALSHMTPVVKKVMETYGPQVTGAPLTVEKVSFSLLQTRFEMTGLVLGNPAGFKTPNSVEVGRILVKVRPLSLFTDTIHVQQILVEKPAITYEVGLGETNIGTILKNVEKFSASFEKVEKVEKKPEPEEEKKPGKKVVIDEVCVSGGQVRLSATFLQGNAAPIPLSTVTLHDLGKESNGISLVKATQEVLTKVLTSVTDVGKKAIDALGDVGKKAGEALEEGAKKAGEALEKGVEKLKNLF